MCAKKPTVAICTLGCKVNQYESEAIAEAFEAADFSLCSHRDICDVYVFNTCTVTAEAERKAGQLIRRIHAKAPNAHILVTGCFSQAAPELVAALPGVDYICGNTDKLGVVRAASALLDTGRPTSPIFCCGDVNTAPFEPMHIQKFDRTRAYVKIEDGCESRCAYCAIPAARGRVRSKQPREILDEIKGLVDGGCREIVLTGIETASYGKDLDNYGLAELLEQVDAIPGIGRVRLGSLDPSLMKDAFVTRIAKLPSLAHHFHLSVQSGSSAVLAAMRRKYNRDMVRAGIERLKKAMPDVQLTADFIVGFPGETDEDFAQTMSLAKDAEFLQMHVFSYSRRRNTPAAQMPDQIPASVKKERSAALIGLGTELRTAQLEKALLSPLREVLFESFENGLAIGHTAEFFEVAMPSPVPLHSELHTVRLCAVKDGRLLAEPMKGDR